MDESNNLNEVAVAVVDDQSSFRAAASIVVEATEGFSMVGEAADTEAAIALARTTTIDLILMDINLGETNGIELTRTLRTEHPGLEVILMSTYSHADLPDGASTCGAMRYVHKEHLSPANLVDAWRDREENRW